MLMLNDVSSALAFAAANVFLGPIDFKRCSQCLEVLQMTMDGPIAFALACCQLL